MENHKITFTVIIILLVIFIPMTIFATTMHFKNATPVEENPNHEKKYNGKLYFYNGEELVGTYECKYFNEYCDYATSRTTNEYALDEYQEQTLTTMPIIENQYAFLMDTPTNSLDTAEYILYDFVNQRVWGKYKEVKNYGIGIENNNYIVKNTNDLWGVLQIDTVINIKIPISYDYIGLVNKIDADSGYILADTFAVLKEEKWQLIDKNGAELTESLNEEIFSYNEKYVVLGNNNAMHIVDYKGEPVLNGVFKYINFYSIYLEIIDNNNMFYLYDLTTKQMISKTHPVNAIDDVEIKLENNTIAIYIKNNLEEKIEISENIS